MKTIIAPTDFSLVSLNAVKYATDMALNINANLLLVNIAELPVGEVPVTEENCDEMLHDAQNELFKLQEKLVKEVNHSINIDTHASVGTLLNKLEKICNIHEPLVVVMGTEERGAIEKLFIGNSTTAALHYLHFPVLVVPATAKFKPVSKICLACDLKEIYDLPLKHIKLLANTFHAKLDIVHVCKTENDKLQHNLAGKLVEQRLHELHPTTYYAINKNIDEGVRQYAEENKEDILLVIPKKRGFIESLFHKSHSKSFSAHPDLPVMNIAE